MTHTMKSIGVLITSLTVLLVGLISSGYAQIDFRSVKESITVEQRQIIDAPFRTMLSSLASERAQLNQAEALKRHPAVRNFGDGRTYVDFLIELEPGASVTAMEAVGLNLLAGRSNIYAARIEVEKIPELLATPGIKKIELAKQMNLRHNQSLPAANVPPVHQGVDLGMPVKGEGVIVAIIDSGIDINHPDFMDENGTRIHYLSEIIHGELVSWTKEDIDNNPELIIQIDDDGHGTHVAGSAAGGGKANAEFVGVAPESVIFVSKLLGSSVDENKAASRVGFTTDVITLYEANVEKALELGLPMVVNMSFGHNYGPHDGTELMERLISEYSQEGWLNVVAAGNAGNMFIHAGANINDDNIYQTIFKAFNNTLDWRNVIVKDAWFTPGLVEEVRLTAWENPESQIFESPWVAAGGFEQEMFTINDFEVGMSIDFETLTDSENGDSRIFMGIHSDDPEPYIWYWTIEFNMSGTEGRIDVWNNENGYFFPTNILSNNNQHLAGGLEYSVGPPATAFNIFSVGSTVSKNSWLDINGEEQNALVNPLPGSEGETTIAEIGARSSFSSLGPTRDGRFLPNITAPGEMIFSAHSGDIPVEYWDPTRILFNNHEYQGIDGTSMAAPHVAGILALMLQVYPEMDFDTAWNILETTALVDEFTGSVPNVEFGYGKIDAHAAVKLAAQLATNLPGETELPERITLEQNYPNPFNPVTQIQFALPASEHITLDVYNVLGQRVARLANDLFTAGTHTVAFDASNLASGMYVYRLSSENGTVLTRKMTLIK